MGGVRAPPTAPLKPWKRIGSGLSDQELFPDDPLASFGQAITMAPPGARVDVFRWVGGQKTYVGVMEPDGWSLETAREEFGGGKMYFSLADGRRYLKGVTVTLDGPPRPVATRRDKVEERAERIEHADGVELVRSLAGELRQLVDALRHPPPAAATADPVAMATELIKATGALMEPYADRSSERSMGPAEMFEIFRTGLEFAKEGREGDGWKDRFLREVGTPLVRHITSSRATPAGEGGNAPAGAVPSEPTDADWIGRIAGWAADDKDPGVRAAYFADEAPDEWTRPLVRMAREPGGLSRILTAAPALEPHRDWVEEFLSGLADWVDPLDSEADAKQVAQDGELDSGVVHDRLAGRDAGGQSQSQILRSEGASSASSASSSADEHDD